MKPIKLDQIYISAGLKVKRGYGAVHGGYIAGINLEAIETLKNDFFTKTNINERVEFGPTQLLPITRLGQSRFKSYNAKWFNEIDINGCLSVHLGIGSTSLF